MYSSGPMMAASATLTLLASTDGPSMAAMASDMAAMRGTRCQLATAVPINRYLYY